MVTGGSVGREQSHVTDQSHHQTLLRLLASWSKIIQVRQVRPSMLDEWLTHEEPRLRNVTYNRYAGFLKQLFDIAVKDRIIPGVPCPAAAPGLEEAPELSNGRCPPWQEFERYRGRHSRNQVASAPHAQVTGDFVEPSLGLAGLGQAEASSLTWGDVDWEQQPPAHSSSQDGHPLPCAHLRPLASAARTHGQSSGAESAPQLPSSSRSRTPRRRWGQPA